MAGMSLTEANARAEALPRSVRQASLTPPSSGYNRPARYAGTTAVRVGLISFEREPRRTRE